MQSKVRSSGVETGGGVNERGSSRLRSKGQTTTLEGTLLDKLEVTGEALEMTGEALEMLLD